MHSANGIVLMYHQIIPDDAPRGWVPNPLGDARYGVRLSEFKAQMGLLAGSGIRVLPLSEALEPRPETSEDPFVVITFDDGYESDDRFALPVLEESGFPATFFVSTDFLGQPGMMTPDRAARIAAHPLFNLGGHGASHRFLSVLPDDKREDELVRCQNTVRRLSGNDRIDLSAPGGRISPCVLSDVRRMGFRSLSTSAPGIFRVGDDPYTIPRLPVMEHHSVTAFRALLNPGSLAFRLNASIRSGKAVLRRYLPVLDLSMERSAK